MSAEETGVEEQKVKETKEEEEEEKASWRRPEGTVCSLLLCRESRRQASEEESTTSVLPPGCGQQCCQWTVRLPGGVEGEEQSDLAVSRVLIRQFEKFISGSLSEKILFFDFLSARFCCCPSQSFKLCGSVADS